MAPSGWKVGQEAVADASGLASDGHHSAVVSSKPGVVRHCRGCFNQDVFCEACGGTGSIRDHVPAADAVADAASLVKIAEDLDVGYLGPAFALGGAAKFGTQAAREVWLYEAKSLAELAAEWAFRAVPGLRA